ncbi:MAG TPA: valine--tRNA ligase [Patescibacteria group bacterium]|jgi:valyl-tRNA synthetase|nr:valine--tRNA ligase [Patescibacteria group bacterium]
MDKVYNNKDVEEKIYQQWEEKKYFRSENRFGNDKSYSIILPLPNANAPLHFGHAMFVIEDILTRFHRMQGFKTLWLPGADHAGFETQFVYEKKLQAEGKSRFDFDRDTLYKNIWDFVQSNRPVMESQLRRLGFSLDWEKSKFPLDPDIIKIVYETFKNLFNDGLVYRAKRLVNYCTFDGTSFSDLEVIYEEKQAKLWFIKYPLVGGGSITVATTRPETMLGDTAVVVNPKDKRYKDLVGKKIKLPLTNREIQILADESVDMEFGTGAVKVTPAHDPNDYELGQKYKLEQITVIGFDGKMTSEAGEFEGLFGKQARVKIVEKLTELGFLEKEENITHQVPVCYKCKNPIEPLLMDQWFVKMKPLAEPAIEAVKAKDKAIKIHPKSFEKMYLQFLENIRDWNISRQIVWGIQIPAWSCQKCHEWTVTNGEAPEKCKCGSEELIQDQDVFDTWFSSSQWPYATLKTTDALEFYPTTVMETGYDILRWWVARMVMLGIYIQKKNGVEELKKQIPFQNIVLHGLVNDPLGKKMSKSKGNVVNPMEIVDQYGADAIRFALVYGTALGNDQVLSYPKLEAMRKFSNKLWNMGRFIEITLQPEAYKNVEWTPDVTIQELSRLAKNEKDKAMVQKTGDLVKEITRLLENYDFNHAAQSLYDFAWHEFADLHIEDVKNRIDENSYYALKSLYQILLKLLHPFMPFITEEIYTRLYGGEGNLIISEWPKA